MSESLNHLLSISMTNSLVWTWKVSIVLVPISHTQVPASLRSSLATLKKYIFLILGNPGMWKYCYLGLIITAWFPLLYGRNLFYRCQILPGQFIQVDDVIKPLSQRKIATVCSRQMARILNFTKNHCHHWVKNSLHEKVPGLWIECESLQGTLSGSRDYPSELAAQQVLLLFGNMRI